ncbi:hypothetical protein [Streptomyces gobiensis]|uniref:hypothetical protein n=1 Tax=Streptomyces gobiensis TaxID=2875706 RepID=UPI001E351816|nr:hypothetical protein [Streptomyces gobiensis]UGY90824.1 hypothetical protein test1122_03190 [Streptomyces gobiensis]
MRRRMAALGLIAAAALTAGCASGETVSTDDTDDREQTRFEKRADTIERDWPEVDPVKGRPDDMLPLEGAKQLAADGMSFTVTVGHGACDKDHGVHLRESDKLVIVAGWAQSKDVDFCVEQLVTDDVKVELKESLDDRTVVDAAIGEKLLKG